MNGKETTMPKTNIKVRIIGANGNIYVLCCEKYYVAKKNFYAILSSIS